VDERSETRLAELAVASGLLTHEQLSDARAEVERSRASGEPVGLGQVLARRGWVTTSQLGDLLQRESELGAPPARYEILDELGRGGMAVVYRARDRKLGREVALKVLRREYAESAPTVGRMMREARAIASLDHPNIVRLHDVVDDRPPYLVMELVRGRTLDHELRRGDWPLRERVLAVEQIARAVHAAHERGIVHRDLKPANIMMEGDRPVVMDFGLAHLSSGESRLTRSGAIVGTPQYMAPEQVRSDASAIGPRTDVYALGAILYEAVAGRPMFRGSVNDVYRQILTEDPEPPRRINPRVSADLETICLRCVAREPGDRFPSALALADDLARYAAGEAIIARPISAWTLFGRRLARRKGALGAAMAIVLLAAGAIVMWGALRRKQAELSGTQASLVESMRTTSEACLEAALALRRAGRVGEMRRQADRVEAVCRRVIDELPRLAEPHVRWGRMLRAQMRFDEALAQQELALAKDAANAEARYERAVLRMHRYEAMIESLHRRWSRRQAERRLNDPTHRPPLPSRYELEDDVARRQRALVEEDLRRVDRPVARGLLAWLEGRLADARTILEDVVRSAPDLEEPYLVLGALAAEASRTEEADSWYTRAHEHDRGYVPYLARRAVIRTAEGDRRAWHGGDAGEAYGRASDDIAAATALDPDDFDLIVEAAHVALNWGHWLYERGSDPTEIYRSALGRLDEAIARRPDHVGARIHCSHLHNNVGLYWKSHGGDPRASFERAEAEADEAVRLAPGEHEPVASRGAARVNLAGWITTMGGDGTSLHDSGIADLERALQLDPGQEGAVMRCAAAVMNRGITRAKRGVDFDADFDAALAHADRALAVEGTLAYFWRFRAMIHLNRALLVHDRGDPSAHYGRAVADLDRALRLNGDDDDSWHLRGMARANRAVWRQLQSTDPSDDFVGAMSDFAEALKRNPRRSETYGRRGNAGTNLGLFVLGCRGEPVPFLREAIADLDRAIELNATFEWFKYRGVARIVLSSRAGADEARRLRQDGEADFAEALRRNPRDLDAYVRRGHAYFFAGDWREAAASYRKAIAAQPRYEPVVRERLAMCEKELEKE
jgi:serine/threonine-protein kinase